MPPPFFPEAMRTAPRLEPGLRPGPPQSQRALLINPFYAKDPRSSFGKHVLTPSVAITSVASATPADWRVECWDENLLAGPPPSEPFPAVVGITVHLTSAARAYELSRWYRDRGARVVLGGLHVMSCPDEAAAHADAIAVGDGVALWGTILADAGRGTLAPVYRGGFRSPFCDDPPPRRDLMPRECFLTTTSVIATRGCHNRCGFCYLSTRGVHVPYMMRDVEDVVDEIRRDGQPYAVFIDNNLSSRPEYLRRLCRGLRPLDRIWSAAVSLDVTDDPSLVRDMALAGCTGVFVGLESLNDANAVDARKRSPRAVEFADRIGVFRDVGIQVNASFVFGFDHDRPDIFDRTVAFVEDNRLECATFHILTPYPGTPLFDDLDRAGRLLHRDWSLYDTAHAVFRPRHMGPEELEEGYARVYERLFSHASIWRRRPADAASAAPYFAMSYLYKRSNRLWHSLIRRRLTARVWRPLVEVSRLRHLAFRRRLAAASADRVASPGMVLNAGV